MSAQPLNSDISVFFNVRAQRSLKKGSTIASGLYRLRQLNVAVPGIDGNPALALNRDTTKSDFSPYGEAGFPITYGERGETSLSDMISHVSGAGFAFKIGQDKFLPQAADALDQDFYKSVQTVDTTYKSNDN